MQEIQQQESKIKNKMNEKKRGKDPTGKDW